MKKVISTTLVGALILTAPGPRAWAVVAGAVGRAASAPAGTGSAAGAASVSALSGTGKFSSLQARPQGGLGTSLPVAPALIPQASIVLSARPAAGPASMIAPAAGLYARPGLEGKIAPAAPGKARVFSNLEAMNAPVAAAGERRSKSERQAGISAHDLFDKLLGWKARSSGAGISPVSGRVVPGLRPLLGAAAKKKPVRPAPAAVSAWESFEGPPMDLGLRSEELEKVAEFTSDFHDKIVAGHYEYGFTVRDYYAWARFVRFFTPSLGVQEAVKRGAVYVYADRLETPAERDQFKKDLDAALGNLKLADPKHGFDEEKAEKLLKIAEPDPEALAEDEESPYQFPLHELVPKKENADLVGTPTTLERIDAAYNAFALRDYMLMVGPPATVKSAIPKFLASEYKIPHLAVTLHPGIGTFELVGGYQPKEVKIATASDAKRIVRRALQEAKSGDDFTDILESAAKVYGSNGMAAVLKNIEADLSSEGPGREESRRLVTLAHGIRYGSASLAWQDGYLTFALKRDIWITLEEINAAPTEVVEFLNEFLRSRKLVITEKLGEPETLRPKANGRFMLWATMNHETDSNRQVMADTLKNRWRMKSFGPLPPLEQAEILEEKFGLPQTWALALVENVHNELRRQAVERVIGADWRDGYEINLRHLFKIAKRWKRFVDREEADSGKALDDARKLFLLGRETYAIYGGMMRLDNERSGVFTMIDQAFKLSAAGVSKEEDLVVRPDRIEDLGDAIRIGDVVLKKGKGGPFVPEPNADYLVDENVLARLYQYAKAIALGEPVLLMGETAAGKTSDLEYLYYRLNKNLRYRNLHSDSAIEEVVGGYTTGKKRGKYLFKEGMLPAGMEEGTGVFLDEFNLNPLVEWLNTVVDDNRLFLPHRIVEGKADLVAAANPPEPRYEGRVLLSPAVRSRWTEIWVPADNSKGRLKKLMGHWLKGGAVYALLPLLTAGLIFGPDGALPFLFMGTLAAAGKASDMSLRSLWSGLKGLWPFKKKSDNPGDEDLALPGSLEEVLKNKKIPEADWPKLRAKVERIQTVMKMVGSSVGRDTTLKWVPGYMWAIFPGENTATYPLEHLVTHTPEEVVGLVDHEALHREVTVLDERFPLVRKYLSDPVKHFLWNGLEDPRVNSRGIHRLPGAERYLHAAYDRYIPEELDPAVMREWQAMPHEGLDIPEGDGASLFHPAALRYPHIEFVMAANYYWRFGKKPKAFMNKSAEEAFDKGLPDMKEVFESYPRGQRPEEREKLALSISALKIIDEKLLPLYEPLVQESQKKLAQNKKKGKSKGKKGEGQGKNGKSGGPSPMPPDQKSQKPKPQEQDESGKPGKKELEQALRDLKDHAKKAAENLGGHLKKNPTRKDAGLNGRGPAEKATPGDGKPGALTISEIARNQRQARMAEENSPFRRVHRRVAPFVNSMVSRFENIFYENSRPMDVGYFRRGKKPDIQRAMRREGEGGVKQDIWLRRVHNTKRSYKVSILIDESGSMQGRLREVLDAVTLMMEGLGRLRIDLEIIGFDKVARIHKKFGEAMTKENKERIIAEIEEYFAAGPATHDADAIRLALDRIQAEETDKRLIFVITDGAGNGPSKLADILPDADKAGVYVMGVGIGAGMAYVQEVYPHRALVEDIRDLPATLYKELHEYIQKVERTSSARSAGTVFNFAAVPRGRVGRAALAPGANGVSPVSRVKGFFGGLGLRHLLAWTVWAGYAFLVFQLPPLAVMGVSALAGFAVMALSWRWRDGSIYPLLLFMSGMLPLSSGMSLSMDYGAWTAAAGAAMIALALPAAYSHRYQPLSLPARLELRRVRKANGLEGMGKIVDWLSGTGPQRYGVIVALEKNGGAVARIVPLLEVIARRDPSERIRDGALGLIVKNAVETKKAYDALGKIAASKAPTAPYAARALVKIDEILRRKGDEALEALAAREEADAAAVRAGLIERANAVLRKLSDRTLSGRQRRAAIETAVKYLEAALEGGDADGVKIAAKRLGDQLDAAKERGFGFFAGGTRVAGRSPAAPNAPSLADRSALRRLGDFLTSDKFIHGWLQASWIVPLLSAYWIGEAAILLFGASLFPALLYLIAMIFIRAKKKTYGYPVENLVAQAGAVYFGMPRKDREELKRVLEGVPALYKKKSGLRVKANHPGLYLIYSMVEVRDLAWEQSFEILKRSAYRRAAATLLADIIWDAADAAWSVGGAGLGLLVSQRDYERLAALGEPGRDKLFGLLEADFGPEPERWAGDALADNLLSWSWTREQVERLTALRPDLAARLEEAAPLEAVAGSLAKAAELEGGLGEFLAKARSAARSLKTPAASMINKRRAADIEKRVAAVEGAADEASRALAVERLKEALRRLPGDGGRAFFNAAAGPLNGAVAAAGSGRTLRRLKRFLTRPDMITLLLIPSIEALLFGGMYLFGATIVPLVKPWILFTLIATGIAAFGKGRSMKTQRIGGVLFLLTLSTFLALGAFNAAGDPGGWVVAVMGWSTISFLLTYVMVSAIRRARMGFLHPRARYSIDQAGKKTKLDARGRELLSMLKAYRKARLEALREMLADPEAARGLRPVVDSMLFNDKDPATVSHLIELYARWGDMDARMMLALMEGIIPEENRSAARAVIESIEGRLEAEKELRELMRAGNLTEEKRASEALELLKAGREAAASLTGSSLSLRKRRDALAEAVSSLEAALEHGDLQSLLVSMRRLRAHLERLPQ